VTNTVRTKASTCLPHWSGQRQDSSAGHAKSPEKAKQGTIFMVNTNQQVKKAKQSKESPDSAAI